jgi:hypothetical protein
MATILSLTSKDAGICGVDGHKSMRDNDGRTKRFLRTYTNRGGSPASAIFCKFAAVRSFGIGVGVHILSRELSGLIVKRS